MKKREFFFTMSAGNPDTQIEFLKGVGPQRAEALRAELGIFVFNDLLHCFPFRHVDRTKFYKISEIREEFPFIQVKGKLSGVQIIGAGRHQRLVAELTDETGVLELVWFQGIKWVKPTLQADTEYIVFGRPALFNRKFNIAHPEIEKAVDAAEQKSTGLQPIYSSTEKLKAKGLESKGIAKLVRTLLTQYQPEIEETLPQSLIGKIKMVGRKEAIHHIHFPPDANTLAKATFRLKFEELFFNQLRYLLLKTDREQKVKGHVFSKVGDYFNSFYNNKLPFQLTNAQKRVIREIRLDLGSGRQMNRLLQGDVGSGKTLVALMCMLIALDNGCQSCIMAPTEILASQHYETITQMLDGTGVRVGLLTGSTKTQERKVISEMLNCGEMHIIIGTHALIEDKVQFNNLGFCVIDEQHKFGVAQRAKLWKKNDIPPHVLVMTATPIPRTLAMTVYGDLDRSTIDELPPGRRPIKTIHVYEGDRLKIFNFMHEQIKQGRQVYVVYPLIEESEKLDLKHLMLGYDEILKNFPQKEYGISVVHGKMKADVKDFE
ncbi:MAG: ATP-dependent DNA helicase RecG, partial [Bacteroidota bacterium]